MHALSVVQLPVALADHVNGYVGSGCLKAIVTKKMPVYHTIINNSSPRINAELPLISTPFSCTLYNYII
jgi:hypothetical protein